MRLLFVLLNLFCALITFSQQKLQGVIADSVTKQALPFATVQASNKKASVLSDIHGRYSITIPGSVNGLLFSYTGHKTKSMVINQVLTRDTIFLAPSGTELAEVIVQPVQDKIRRIINAAVENKPRHNPELYDFYQCSVYYKMHADLLGLADDSDVFFRRDKYLLFSETYSRRLYKRPQQLQEIILASRFSGLQKTYFTNMITDVLPFHIYSSYINLNERDYINPIAAGWQQRYRFRLEDELTIDNDTVYVLSFAPKKGVAFNSLQGIVYINANGYAVSHIVASTGDTTADRQVQFEQIYTFINGRWFPKELNYDFTIKHFFSPEATMKWNGHSVIDSVSFNPLPPSAFDKAHPLKLSDSVDLYSEKAWALLRKDPITSKEQNTYHYLDSFVLVNKLERFITLAGRLSVGRLPVGKFDLDINRIIVSNDYEGTRLGLGLYTNDKISKFYSVGGWAGYGFNDNVWKYGASFTLYPNGKKETWLQASYQKNYGNPGEVVLHEDLQNNFSSWLLGKVDVLKEYALTANIRLGYWELRPAYKQGTEQPLYQNNFISNGKTFSSFHHKEASMGLRYAYGEKRFPVFDYYLPADTKYPITYLQAGAGNIQSAGYDANYIRTLAAITYTHHTNRWGVDHFRIDGGFIYATNNQELPQSYLLAGNGFNTNRVSFYASDGFISMKPYDFYTDRFAAFYYRHYFDKFLWDWKWSKPFIGLAHNLIYGTLNNENKRSNAGIRSFENGYHESGILLNQLLRFNVHFADIFFNGGVFYHWNVEKDWKTNSVWVIGVTAGL